MEGVVEREKFAEAPEVVGALADVLGGDGGANGVKIVFGKKGGAGAVADGLENAGVVRCAGFSAAEGGQEGGECWDRHRAAKQLGGADGEPSACEWMYVLGIAIDAG